MMFTQVLPFETKQSLDFLSTGLVFDAGDIKQVVSEINADCRLRLAQGLLTFR